MSNPDENSDGGSKENKNDKEAPENIFRILDDLLAHSNSSRRLILIFIGSALFFAPVAFGLGAVLLGHPAYNIRHLQGGIESSENMPLQGAHLRLVSQNGTVISDMPLQQIQEHSHRSGFIFLGISIFIIVSVIFAGILSFIAIKEYRFFSKWNKRYAKFKSLQDKIDKELED